MTFRHNEYYFKMLEVLTAPQVGKTEKHHVIPKAYFRKHGLKIIDKGNLIDLSIANHYKVHYCLWKCCPIEIEKEMALAFLNLQDTRNSGLEIDSLEYAKAKEQADLVNCVKVMCVETGEIFESVAAAGGCHISDCINGKRKTAFGKHWIRLGEEYAPIYKIECSNGKRYESIKKAAQDLGLRPNAISKQLSGVYKSCKGLKFNYILAK